MNQYNGSLLAICGASFLSEFLTHPFEVLKVKSQIKYNKTGIPPTRFQTYRHFVEKNGFRALYRGFSAGFLRAAQTQTVRLNLYEEINKHFHVSEGATVWQQVPKKFGAAFISSFVAGSTTNAWAVLKVRMITNKKGEYNSLYQAYKTTVTQDGYRELTKGTVITLARGVLGSAIELTAYDALKQILKPRLGSDQLSYFVSSVVASFVSAFFSYPMDVVITLYMNERTHGKEENRGLKRCWSITKEISRKNGVKGFFVGFSGYASRCMAYGPIFWNSLEFFNALAKKERLQV